MPRRSSRTLDWIHGAASRPVVRENAAMIAMRTWARDDVALPALRRWLDAGHDAELRRADAPSLVATGPHRPRAPDLGQPPAGRGQREEVHQPRDEPPRPRPGGQRRADARRRQVRVGARLQVLDLRDVVDPPGDPARPRGPVADDPHPGPHGRDDEPRHPDLARAHGRARARADERRDRRGPVRGSEDRDHGREGRGGPLLRPEPGLARDADRRRERHRARHA